MAGLVFRSTRRQLRHPGRRNRQRIRAAARFGRLDDGCVVDRRRLGVLRTATCEAERANPDASTATPAHLSLLSSMELRTPSARVAIEWETS